jgi:F0F1-type ATP synthase membrane subunit c/vacuolar-type H+-ATPase subunit K
MPDTVVDLGKKTKLKYPGEYDDLNDAEVGRKVKAKYPGDYDDFTDVTVAVPASSVAAAPAPSTPDTGFKNPILRAAGDFTFGAVKTGAMDMLKAGEFLTGTNPMTATMSYLARRLGMPKVSEIPAVKSFLTPPPGLASGIGQFAATAGEFMLPGGLPAKGIKAVEALVKGAPKLVSKLAPPIANVAGQGMTAGGVELLRTGGDVDKAKTVGLVGAAIPAVTGPLGSALSLVFGRALNPKQLYQSALRPPPGKGAEAVEKVVEAGLKERIPVSEKGYAMAGDRWHDLNEAIGKTISNDPSKPINVNRALKSLTDLKAKWSYGSGDPAFEAAVNQVEKNFRRQYAIPKRGPGHMTGEQAQEVKKGLYREIRLSNEGAWNATKPNTLDVQAKQEIARGLKLELEAIYPQIKNLNEREGAVIELERALSRFVAREGNIRITPYFAAVGAGAAFTAAGEAGAGAAMGMGILGAHLIRSAIENPEVKSKLAFALLKVGKPPIARTAGQLGAAGAAMSQLSPPPR